VIGKVWFVWFVTYPYSDISLPVYDVDARGNDVWDDDGDGNLMALFVLDEIPVEVISIPTLNSTHY
jgi:hypothetical protein